MRPANILLGLFLVLPFLAATTLAQPKGAPEERFELARSAFEYQDHDKVIELLDPLLNPTELLPTQSMVHQAREWLGAARWWKQDKVGFKQEFTHLLKATPAFELDSFYYPPDMIADFQKLKEQLIQLQIIEVKVADPEVPPPVTRTIYVETTIEKRSPLINFVPFGVGQFANGRTGKGIVFLTGQTLLLSANVGSWLYLYTVQPHGASRTAALGTMYGSLAAFSGLALWGILDAYADWTPQRTLEEKRLEKPGESATMWQMVPWPVAGGIGFSVGTPF
jgi:TM2 domain-containing membrane protein YozV